MLCNLKNNFENAQYKTSIAVTDVVKGASDERFRQCLVWDLLVTKGGPANVSFL